MSEPSPASELRTAAASLRTRAKAVEPDVAILHSAPWETESCDAGCQCIVSQTEPGSADIARVGRYIADAESPELADWIALMGPGLGPLLADWLETTADYIESSGTQPTHVTRAYAIARAVNAKEQP